ncbi:hypothetical protein M8J75_006954 [Diaphorina citri]|nr:hypothetical protein M8J75_006954 [Diaphorina citri]
MSDLDSFFAKKDKKKGKAGKKFATTEEIAKKLEDITLKKDKVKKDKPQSINPDDTNNGNENEDEWKEFQEDKKDYSGLKLQPLKVTDINTLDNDKGQNELNEDGTEMSENGKKKPGPWKISDNQNETKPVEEPPKPKPSNSTGTYVCLEPLTAGKIREALDVTSTVAFPTLQAAKTGGPKVVESVWNKRRVENDVRPSSEPSSDLGSNSQSRKNNSCHTFKISNKTQGNGCTQDFIIFKKILIVKLPLMNSTYRIKC